MVVDEKKDVSDRMTEKRNFACFLRLSRILTWGISNKVKENTRNSNKYDYHQKEDQRAIALLVACIFVHHDKLSLQKRHYWPFLFSTVG